MMNDDVVDTVVIKRIHETGSGRGLRGRGMIQERWGAG
jgi:hypothetical protein